MLHWNDVNEESRVNRKSGNLLLQEDEWEAIQQPQTVSGGLVQIGMAVLFASLLLMLLLPALCLVMARRMKLWLGWNYGLGCLSEVINHSAFLRFCLQPLLFECVILPLNSLGAKRFPGCDCSWPSADGSKGQTDHDSFPSLIFQGASLK